METPVKMKSTDPEYFKMYQRELYKTKLCQKINCKTCGATVSVKALKRHSETPRCRTHAIVQAEKNPEIRLALETMLKKRGGRCTILPSFFLNEIRG